jgi:hypothetical protein
MLRTAIALSLALVVPVCAALAAEQPKYSGKVVAIDPSGQTITLEELGPGTSSGNQVIARRIRLTPQTNILVASRVQDERAGSWPGTFTESPVEASSLSPGDFVTVEAQKRDGRLVAVSVVVVRPGPSP